jgi:translocation and assembly module TamB
LRLWAKRIGWALLGLLLLVGAALLLADTSWGHRQIIAQVEGLSPKSGLKIGIGEIEGSIYGESRLKDVVLSDPKGAFLRIPEAELNWSPFSWWNNRLDMESLTAKQANLLKLPKFNPSDRKGPILPDFDIRIGRLAIERLDIAAGVAGAARTGRLEGKAEVAKGRADIDLKVDAAQGDDVQLRLMARPDTNQFDLDGVLNAPAGGVFAQLLGTSKTVEAKVGGSGTWSRWSGNLNASLGGTQIVRATVQANRGEFGLEGATFLASITKGKVQRLAGERTILSGKARLADRRLTGALTVSSAALAIDGRGTLDLGDNRFDGVLINARLLQPPALFPNMTGRDVRLAARLNGPFRSAAFDYLLTSPSVAFGPTGLEEVRASGQGRWSAAPVIVPIRLTAKRITGVGDVAGGILANAKAEGLLRVTAASITGDGINFTSDKLSGKLRLFIDLKTGVYDVGLAAQLLSYFIPGLGIVDVKSDLKAIPDQSTGKVRVLGTAEARVRRFDSVFFQSLAGGLPVLTTALERMADGSLRFFNMRITAPKISFVGSGLRRPDGTLLIDGAGQQSVYGPFRLGLDGMIDRPKIDLVLARPADALGLANVNVKLDPSATGFSFVSNGGSTLGRFTGSGNLLLSREASPVVAFDALNVSGVKAAGRLTVDRGALAGQLQLLGGGLTGSLAFVPYQGGQQIDANVTMRDARFEGPPVLQARRGQFEGVIRLANGRTSVDGTFTGQGLARGDFVLARLAANVRLVNGIGEVRASLAGSRGRSFDLQTVVRVGDGRLELVGSGTIDRRPVALADGTTLIRTAEGWRLAPTELSFAGGKARVSGLFGERSAALDASLQQMPLAIADIVSPGLGLGGVANGKLSYALPANGTPTGRADLKIKGLTRSGLVLSSLPIDMGLAATLNGTNAGVRMIAVAGGKEIGRAQARLTGRTSGGLIERFADAQLFGQIRYNGGADALWRLSGVETLDVAGPIALGADVTGRVNDPIIRGSLRTSNARIESPATGMVLTGVAATGRFGQDSKLVFDNFSATAGKDGRISGSGVVDLASARGFAISLSIQAENASLLARDDVAATVTGPLQIRSDGGEGIISGDVILNRGRFRLGRVTAAQSLPRLKVREINGRTDEVVATRAVMPWRLALKAKAPSRFMVTGLGLDSEWQADLNIGGTPYAPTITGRADLLRGDYEFAGRRFGVTRGAIRFQGENPPDPALDIHAEGSTQGLSATIRVTGSGQKPQIRFASTPSLPEDELLSRLLFGTSISNLSAPEAVQLAAAVASLRDGGNGLNPINALRNAIGLDRLRILPADTVTGQGTSVAAGKYLSRRAYVEIVTDGAGYSATNAEFQVSRFLSILGSISTIGRQRASIRISKDY